MLWRLTLAAWQGHAPLPGGGAAGGLGAAGPVALLAAHGAGGVVAEAPPGLGAVQASVLRDVLGRAGHHWKGKPSQCCPLSAPVGGGTPGTAAPVGYRFPEHGLSASGHRMPATSPQEVYSHAHLAARQLGLRAQLPAMVPGTWGIWGLNLEGPASRAQPLPTDPGHHMPPGKRRPADPAPSQRARPALPSQGGTGGIRLTLLAPEATEAGVALASVVVDGLHAVAMAAAGRRGAGSCGHTGMARGSTVSTTDVTNDMSARRSD